MNKVKHFGFFALIIIPILLIIFLTANLNISPIRKSVTVEAGGNSISISRFMKNDTTDAEFITDLSSIDFNSPGKHTIKISSDGKVYSSELIIEDTTPPSAKPVDRYITVNETLTIWDFLTDVYDATEISAYYKTEPVFGINGTSYLIIYLSDTSGNTTAVSCQLVISKLVEEIVIEAGSAIPDVSEFLAVESTDVKLITDTSTINTGTVKKYPIVISVDGEEFSSTLKIVDTVPPVATPIDAVIYKDYLLSSYQLVTDIIDETKVVVYSYDERPFGQVGTYTVNVILRDEGGNTTKYTSKVTVTDDESLVTIKDE